MNQLVPGAESGGDSLCHMIHLLASLQKKRTQQKPQSWLEKTLLCHAIPRMHNTSMKKQKQNIKINNFGSGSKSALKDSIALTSNQ